MKLQIEDTEHITLLDGVPVRVWQGVTESGMDCLVFVHRIAVDDRKDLREFDQDLQEQLPPGRVVPLSAIL